MERSWFSTIGSLFTATLFAGALLLSGCSDSLTGTQPAQDDVTVQTNDADTNPAGGHNTSDED